MQGDFFLHVVRSLTPRKTAKIALVMYFQPIGLAFAYCYSIFNRRKSSPAVNSTLALLAPFSNTFQRSGLAKRTILLPSSAPFRSSLLLSDRSLSPPFGQAPPNRTGTGRSSLSFRNRGPHRRGPRQGKRSSRARLSAENSREKVGGSLQGQAGGKGEIEDYGKEPQGGEKGRPLSVLSVDRSFPAFCKNYQVEEEKRNESHQEI